MKVETKNIETTMNTLKKLISKLGYGYSIYSTIESYFKMNEYYESELPISLEQAFVIILDEIHSYEIVMDGENVALKLNFDKDTDTNKYILLDMI